MRCVVVAGEIIYVDEYIAKIRVSKEIILENDLMNLHLVFIDQNRRILGEVTQIDFNVVTISLIGEFVGNNFILGIEKKPKFSSSIRTISKEEMDILVSSNDVRGFNFGFLPQYNNYPYRVNIDELFGHHIAIFGNTGSGKSYGLASIFQSLFYDKRNLMNNSRLILFDAHGEYKKSFGNLSICKVYDDERKLFIPLWLLDVYDIAMLLDATKIEQIVLLEKVMRLVRIFSNNNNDVVALKNHLIAKAILSVMYSSKTSAKIRNEVFDILNLCSTKDISLSTSIKGIGYERSMKKCFEITRNGTFAEEILVTSFLETFINDDLEMYMDDSLKKYDLKMLEDALSFTIISENILINEGLSEDISILQVKLHSIATGEFSYLFDCTDFINENQYVDNLYKNGNRYAQMVLINMGRYDEKIGKFIVKILSKFIFNYSKNLPVRASMPFHIVLEEAHKYIYDDFNSSIMQYDIFSKIAKEGRKYGVILIIVTQRPTELNDNVISQCSNFILFRTNHPNDIEFLKMTIPNVDSSIIDKQKCIQPGNCIGFGRAFKLPMVIKLRIPNPTPLSDNANIYTIWKG